MTDTEIRQRIIDICNNEKPDSAAIPNEQQVKDFPASLAKTSFRQSRKYYRFMDKMELAFGICFSYDDLDKTYTIDALTKKVSERLDKKKSNEALLKQRQVKYRYIFEIILLVLVVAVIAWQGISWLSLSITVIAVTIIYWLVSSKLYNQQHNKKLQLKMSQDN